MIRHCTNCCRTCHEPEGPPITKTSGIINLPPACTQQVLMVPIAAASSEPYLIKRTGVHLDRNFGPSCDPVALPYRLDQQSHQLRRAEGRCSTSKKESFNSTGTTTIVTLPPHFCRAHHTIAAAGGIFDGVFSISSPRWPRGTPDISGNVPHCPGGEGGGGSYLANDVVDVRSSCICSCAWSVAYDL